MTLLTIVVDDLAVAKRQAMWGTFGKKGKGPMRWVRLVGCETEHLQAILNNVPGVPYSDYGIIIRSILEDRNEALSC